MPYKASATRRGEVGQLAETLGTETVRSEAAAILVMLIERVTIEPHGPEAEMVSKVSAPMVFATNDNAAREGGDGRCKSRWLRGHAATLIYSPGAVAEEISQCLEVGPHRPYYFPKR